MFKLKYILYVHLLVIINHDSLSKVLIFVFEGVIPKELLFEDEG